jgi:hypothetical protein
VVQWKQIVSQPGRSLEDRFHAWIDNTFSRVVGFFVRSGVLFAAGLSLVAVILFSIIEAAVWPLLPLAIPVLIIAGVLA